MALTLERGTFEENDGATVVPALSEVRETLDRILMSPEFDKQERCRHFLFFVVNAWLDGAPERITATTIATTALNQSKKTFNPKNNSMVRVHAGRLRAALDEYYKGNGRAETLRISIANRNYRPVFEKIAPQKASTVSLRSVKPDQNNKPDKHLSNYRFLSLTKQRMVLIITAAFIIGFVLIAVFVAKKGITQIEAKFSASAVTMQDVPIVIQAIDTQGQNDLVKDVSTRMVRLVRGGLSLFDDISVVDDPSGQAFYRLKLSIKPIQDSNLLSLKAELLREQDGQRVWEYKTDNVDPTKIGGVKSVAAKIIFMIGDNFGVMLSDLRKISAESANSEIRCDLLSYALVQGEPGLDPKGISACLDRTAINTPVLSADVMHAYTLGRSYADGLYEGANRSDLQAALEFAKRAFDSAPAKQRNQLIYGSALFEAGKTEEGMEVLREGLGVNPYANDIRAELGSQMVRRGSIDQGLELMTGVQPNIEVPLRYEQYAALGFYMKGDIGSATRYVESSKTPPRPFSLVMRILVCSRQDGRASFMKQAAGQLKSSYPKYASDLRASFLKDQMLPTIADRLISDLEQIGISKSGELNETFETGGNQ